MYDYISANEPRKLTLGATHDTDMDKFRWIDWTKKAGKHKKMVDRRRVGFYERMLCVGMNLSTSWINVDGHATITSDIAACTQPEL